MRSPVADTRPRELPGLAASAGLRCDDFVTYLMKSYWQEGAGMDKAQETLAIATLPGGTMVIPHLGRAFEFWELPEDNKVKKFAKLSVPMGKAVDLAKSCL